MSLPITPPPVGESYSLSIRNINGDLLHSKSIKSPEEGKLFCSEKCVSVKYYHLKSLLFPCKSEMSKDYLKLLLLPTVFVTAKNVDGFVGRIFLYLVGLPLDLLSLPFRLVCSPLKAIYDNYFAEKKSHPLEAYLMTLPELEFDSQKKELINSAIKAGQFEIIISTKTVKTIEDRRLEDERLSETFTEDRTMCITKEMPINRSETSTKYTSYTWRHSFIDPTKSADREWIQCRVGRSSSSSSSASF